MNVTDEGFRLVVAWLTAALRPVGPYPILSLHGEQGSAKSTLARILRLLVDPQACPLLVEPASTRDLMVTGRQRLASRVRQHQCDPQLAFRQFVPAGLRRRLLGACAFF